MMNENCIPKNDAERLEEPTYPDIEDAIKKIKNYNLKKVFIFSNFDITRSLGPPKPLVILSFDCIG